MRFAGSVLMMVVVLNTAWVGAAHAQLVCTLGVGPVRYNPYQDMPPSSHAATELMRIHHLLCSSSPYGCGSYVLARNPTVSNAMAMAVSPGLTKIVYNAGFMNSVAGQYGGGATFGILAHEFGHHIDFHTTPFWMNTSWSRELKADAWAGCALARAGIGTTAIENALIAIATYPSPSHPDWPRRQQAVRTGFVSCGGQWLQRFSLY